MHTQSMRIQALGTLPEPRHKAQTVSDIAGRLIQVILALYLIPVLFFVLMVGGMGCIVLSLGRLISTVNPIHRTAG